MHMLLPSLLLLATGGAPVAQDSTGLSFQATVESIKITARPGQVITRQFRLTLDPNARQTHFKARIEDWWRSEDGRQSFYGAPGTLNRSCATWVSLNPVESAVQPGGTLTVRVTVAVPQELVAGGYWCALTVDEVPDPLATEAGVAVRFVASVSTGVFVYIEPVQRVASILDLQVTSDEALVTVRNDGNAPLGIEGRLEFFAAGATTPTATAIVPRGTVLPEPSTSGILASPLPVPATLPSGRYRVRAILDFGADHYIGAERTFDLVREAAASDPTP
jgi:hypothetical protein